MSCLSPGQVPGGYEPEGKSFCCRESHSLKVGILLASGTLRLNFHTLLYALALFTRVSSPGSVLGTQCVFGRYCGLSDFALVTCFILSGFSM